MKIFPSHPEATAPPGQEVHFHNQFIETLCAQHQLWGVSKAYGIANRKNVQVMLMSSPFLLQAGQSEGSLRPTLEIARQYQQMVAAILQESYLPALESYYRSKILRYFRFFPVNLRYYFTVKIFEEPLFKRTDAFQAEAERRITNCLSRRFSQILRYGPEKVTVAIAAQRYVVVWVQGLLSPFQITYAAQSAENDALLVDMATALLDEVTAPVWQEEGIRAVEEYTEVECFQNQILRLAVFRPISEADFAPEKEG